MLLNGFEMNLLLCIVFMYCENDAVKISHSYIELDEIYEG